PRHVALQTEQPEAAELRVVADRSAKHAAVHGEFGRDIARMVRVETAAVDVLAATPNAAAGDADIEPIPGLGSRGRSLEQLRGGGIRARARGPERIGGLDERAGLLENRAVISSIADLAPLDEAELTVGGPHRPIASADAEREPVRQIIGDKSLDLRTLSAVG